MLPYGGGQDGVCGRVWRGRQIEEKEPRRSRKGREVDVKMVSFQPRHIFLALEDCFPIPKSGRESAHDHGPKIRPKNPAQKPSLKICDRQSRHTVSLSPFPSEPCVPDTFLSTDCRLGIVTHRLAPSMPNRLAGFTQEPAPFVDAPVRPRSVSHSRTFLRPRPCIGTMQKRGDASPRRQRWPKRRVANGSI
jgi:hypothetical protein